ncbi:glucosamine-6-phosphate deaminase NagB-II [Shewanella sp. UCD-KL12]|uniref:glucosamine-6-phosphate deaminase NagB-II n=1 Tax=Shewanella sp. UCD-KL12 TaxID=1917163 RepID=UPI000970D68D|nr:SIS domain-containing protein [Shewanella sp. UCD-KL12]
MKSCIMEHEAREAPKVVAAQLTANALIAQQLGEKIRSFEPQFVMIIGRGSSDHAGVFGKYLIEIEVGLPTFSAAPSVTSVYGKQLKLDKALVIIISQSGTSPDILAQASMAKAAGALCIALVNEVNTPLEALVDYVLPLRAGEERAISASKSYIATLSALMQLVSTWTQDVDLALAVKSMPIALENAVKATPQLVPNSLTNDKNLVVLGRGLGFAIAKEIALKLKELCGIHAEAFSSAEFLHGPVTLIEQDLKVIDVSVGDESYGCHIEQVVEVNMRGADLIHLHQTTIDIHPRIAPIALLLRFYIDVVAVAKVRGIDPDSPVGLTKMTETL